MKAGSVASVAVVGLIASGCGSQEASVVEKALDSPVKSAQVSLQVQVRAQGRQVASVSLTGPFAKSGTTKLATFDWRVQAAVAGHKTIRTRVISTGDDVFVRYGGTTYEVGKRRVARLNRQAARAHRHGGQVDGIQDLARLGVDLQKWFPESGGAPRDAEVGGVPTRRVTGRLDVSVALQDLARLAKRPEFRAQLHGQVPDLTPADIRMIDALITDPRFTLDAGRRDGKLRRLSADFGFQDPRNGGRGSVHFVLRLSRLGQPARIVAPTSGKPIEQLLQRLGMSGRAAGAIRPA